MVLMQKCRLEASRFHTPRALWSRIVLRGTHSFDVCDLATHFRNALCCGRRVVARAHPN
jgi:hypothetical protein